MVGPANYLIGRRDADLGIAVARMTIRRLPNGEKGSDRRLYRPVLNAYAENDILRPQLKVNYLTYL